MADNLENANQIKELSEKHRELDLQIERLASGPDFDQIKLQRLKKEKLALKDQLAVLGANQVPDIIA
ncbi:MAG: YdcH family protein [Rhodospirillales bacterium]|jgi:hypothetical protein